MQKILIEAIEIQNIFDLVGVPTPSCQKILIKAVEMQNILHSKVCVLIPVRVPTPVC
jgi:hypothetical protein